MHWEFCRCMSPKRNIPYNWHLIFHVSRLEIHIHTHSQLNIFYPLTLMQAWIRQLRGASGITWFHRNKIGDPALVSRSSQFVIVSTVCCDHRWPCHYQLYLSVFNIQANLVNIPTDSAKLVGSSR